LGEFALDLKLQQLKGRLGQFGVVGADRRISLFDLAARAKEMRERGEIAEDLTSTPRPMPRRR
jgi:hypothetical protein